jgi:hypothetical protein
MADVLINTEIDLADLTNATTVTNGTGYFDVLMSTINIHINHQYTENRLRGADYATVYLGLVQTAMAQSQQFLLQEQLEEAQIDKLKEEIRILRNKT